MLKKLSIGLLITLLSVALILFIALKLTTYNPAPLEPIPTTCNANAPTLKPGQQLKVLSWNVQYMASKNYVFYYDTFESDGPDDRPSAEHIAQTLDEVARVIKDEAPDVIMIQEIDQGAKRTDYQDQVQELKRRLDQTYACVASTPYWKASFVPHGRIMGRVNMALAIYSKYKMAPQGQRLALPMFKQDWLTDHFYLRRAIQRQDLPIEGQPSLALLNTHLDAFAQGSDTMNQQVQTTLATVKALDEAKQPWLLGGDFNLLATERAYKTLSPIGQRYFNPKTELEPLISSYQALPSAQEIDGPQAKDWLTHFPNNPKIKAPDRTIDYLFSSSLLKHTERRVRQHDTLAISDHLPLVTTITLPQ